MFFNLWEDDDEENPIVYDPVRLGTVFVASLFVMGVLFWTLWCLLVYQGGLFVKVGPFLQVVFTSKTLKDFGGVASPYALGVFEGWWVNVLALVVSFVWVVLLWRTFYNPKNGS